MISNFLRQCIPERFRPIGYLVHMTQTRTGCTVLQGPFKGMHYAEDSQGSAYIPKLLGIYERELSSIIEEIISKTPKSIVDIGAAEGYYAIGLARRLPNTKIVAFEMEAKGSEKLLMMAEANEVNDRIELHGKCEVDCLESAINSNASSVIICDVEGYETELLDPGKVPSLKFVSILVEVHDFIIDGITDKLYQRFNITHDIKRIWEQPRSVSDFPWRTLGTAILPKSYLKWSVSEWRPVRMSWLWMTPRA